MTMILTNSRERSRFLRFALVGAIGAIVDFGTFNLLEVVFGVPAVLASVLSFIAAVVNNFLWNRYWTYPDSRTKAPGRQLAEFTIISLIGLGIRTPVFALLEGVLRRFFASSHLFTSVLPVDTDFLGHNLALAIAVGLVMFWNFFINRYWTYGDVD